MNKLIDFRDYIHGQFIVDFYLVIKKEIPNNRRNHVEVITSKGAGHMLSPSKTLRTVLQTTGISISEYKIRFLNEMLDSEKAIKRMFELIVISKDKDIFLICYEKDPKICHRSIVQKILQNAREKMRGRVVNAKEGKGIIAAEIVNLLNECMKSTLSKWCG